MTTRKVLPFPPVNRPMPTVWTDRVRGAMESALDSESSATLACFLSDCFNSARNWGDLVRGLSARGFQLCFEDGRLVLVNEQTGASMCTCASLGHNLTSLAARLGKPSVMADTGQLVSKPGQES